MSISRFTVVTPCVNAAGRILATAESVLRQNAVRSGRVSLQYLVCDGASRDATPALLRREFGDAVTVRSEPDRTMYDALAKGLRDATGDVVSYLNAGDVYHPAAFDVVADLMEARPIRWITGMHVMCNDALQVTGASVPFRFRRDFLRKGLYGRELPFMQQESTFWRRSLHSTVDFDVLASMRYAGDAYLWRCFAREEEPAVVASYLGGFTCHPHRLSVQLGRYRAELAALADPPGLLDGVGAAWERLLWKWLSFGGKRRRNPLLFVWDEPSGTWRSEWDLPAEHLAAHDELRACPLP